MFYYVLTMIIVAYLCGSLSSAVIISQVMRLPDPRTQGSKNPGATNVLRVGGPIAGLLVLLLDMAKGLIPVWIAYRLDISPFFLGIIAIAACLGHIYPCFFHFQGGKGVATALGTMAAIGWDFTSLFSITWLLAVFISGYSSVGSIVSFLLAPFYVWYFRPELTMPVAMLSCLIIARHSSNMQRLIQGEEGKIWKKKTQV